MNPFLAYINKPTSYPEGISLLKTLSPGNELLPFLQGVKDPRPQSLHFSFLIKELKRVYRIKKVNNTLPLSPAKDLKAKPSVQTKKAKPVFYKNDFVNVETLPGEYQQLFLRNQNITRELSGLHQMLKEAATNKDRLPLAEKIKALNQERILNWKEIDQHAGASREKADK